MVAFRSRTLLFFDARTWTLIIAWYQIITTTLDISRSNRQLQKYNKLNEQLPLIYHNFTKSLNVNLNINDSSSVSQRDEHGKQNEKIENKDLFPTSTLSINTNHAKSKENNTITIIITLDDKENKHSNNRNHDNSTSSSTSSLPANANSNAHLENANSITTNTVYNVSSNTDTNTNTNPLPLSLPLPLQANLSVWDEIQNLKPEIHNNNTNINDTTSNNTIITNANSLVNDYSISNNATINTNSTNDSTNSFNNSLNRNPNERMPQVKNATMSSEETKSQFLFRFRYTIIMIWADIVVYTITGISAIILIIGTNKGSAGMLMTWLVVNWINFLLALFAMIIVMLRALPINTFIYYAMKTTIRMLFIRVVSIHRREVLIYNDICQHLANIRQAQQAVFTMSDGMTHVNYVNP